MGGAIQEVGHDVIAGISDDDGDGYTEHDVANTPLHNDEIYGTPMGVSYFGNDDYGSFNECDQRLSPLETSRHVDFRFSGCAGKKMG